MREKKCLLDIHEVFNSFQFNYLTNFLTPKIKIYAQVFQVFLIVI